MKEQINPFDKATQELYYLAFDHGSNAETREDCPYPSDDDEERQSYAAWMQGFNTRKGKKPRRNAEAAAGSLEAMPTDALEQELIKRKQKELAKLKQRQAELLKTLKDLSDKINKIEILCGG